MVVTFEDAGSGPTQVGSFPSLGAASEALPAGSYTTLRTYGGDRVLRLGQHVERLRVVCLRCGGDVESVAWFPAEFSRRIRILARCHGATDERTVSWRDVEASAVVECFAPPTIVDQGLRGVAGGALPTAPKPEPEPEPMADPWRQDRRVSLE